MQFTATQIAALVNGQIEGKPDVVVHTIAKIETAKSGALSFIANPKYLPYAHTTGASILLVNEDFQTQQTVTATLIRVKDAYSAFTRLLELYQDMQQQKTGIEQPVFIANSVQIGKDAYVGAFSYLGENVQVGDKTKIYPQCYLGDNVTIGANTTIHPGVKIYANTIIGDNCILHSGVVLGGDGFGFAPQADGTFKKIPQIGQVILEDDVEIGANTTVDCATMGATVIKKGVKLDNLIQIAHNVEVGEHTVIAAQTGISGSTKIGKHCFVGGQVGFMGHIKVADNTKINAMSGVSKSVRKSGQFLNGIPAFDWKKTLRSQAVFRNLPDLVKRIQALEAALKDAQTKS